MGRPILANKEHGIYVHQPIFSDIVDIGEDEYNLMILPFILTTDSVFNGVENEEELSQKFHLFDLFFAKLESGKNLLDKVFGDTSSLELLSDSLRYFLKVEDVRILEVRQKILVNNSYIIDKNEFDILRKIIQDVVGRNDIEVEKPPKNMTKRQRDIWAKLQKGRKRKAERDAIYLQDIVNYISFGGNSYISTDEIDRMTYYQFQNAYKSIMGRDAFDVGMGYKLSQKFDVKDDVKHWTEALKIGK